MNSTPPFSIYDVTSCGSTNEYIKDLIKIQPSKPTLLISNEQTSGKGQRENSWISPKGAGWYFSIYLPNLSIPLHEVHRINWVVTTEIIQTLLGAGVKHAQIKWPNDIYTPNGKLGGVLIENQTSSNSIKSTIIGIGINTGNIEVEKSWKGVTNLRHELGSKIGLLQFKTNHLHTIALNIYYNLTKPLLNLEVLRQKVLKYSFGLQRYFIFDYEHQKIKAKVIDIDKTGKLLLEGENGVFAAASGSLKWINEI